MLGLPKSLCTLIEKMLDTTIYSVKTQMGVSGEQYSSQDGCKIHGISQGNRAGPPKWDFLISPGMDEFEATTNRATFVSPDNSYTAKCNLDGFLEDLSEWLNRFSEELKMMQDGYSTGKTTMLLQNLI